MDFPPHLDTITTGLSVLKAISANGDRLKPAIDKNLLFHVVAGFVDAARAKENCFCDSPHHEGMIIVSKLFVNRCLSTGSFRRIVPELAETTARRLRHRSAQVRNEHLTYSELPPNSPTNFA